MNLQGYIQKYKEDRFFKEVFLDGFYLPTASRNKKFVIDVGACAGEFSFVISGGSEKVYAIEPEEGEFKELEENIKDFGFSNVQPFNLAISDHNDYAYLHLGVRGGHRVEKEPDPNGNSQKVQCKTLATFIKDNKIDYVDILKVDVEGHEDYIFKSEDFPEVADKIDFIIGEHMSGVSDYLVSLGFKKGRDDHNEYFYK